MTTPLALQLYTLQKEARRDFAAVLEWVSQIGFVGVETAGRLHTFSPQEFVHRLDDLGLLVAGSYLIGEGDEVPRFLDEQQAIHNSAVVWGLGPEDFESRPAIEAAADKVNALADVVRVREMTLSYYNHWWEYTALHTGEIPMDLFLPRLDHDVLLEFGVYWNQTAGCDPAAVLSKLGRRVRRIHLQDGPCTRTDLPTVIGTGKVDFPNVLSAARAAEWYVVAFDEFDGDILQAVEGGYRYLTTNGLATGRV